MTHKARIDPIDQEFEIGPGETILEAAVRAGVPLEYACSSGNCGQCKAQLMLGEVAPVRHQDYVLTAQEKAQGWVLLCTNTAISDIVMRAGNAGQVGEIPLQEVTVKVRKLERIEDELIILNVQTPRSQRLQFIAGQYVTISVPEVGSLDASIASCPCDDRHLEFHIRRVSDEPVSEHLFDGVRPGMTLDLTGPRGEFVLDEGDPRPLILVAFDTGFAAIKSILEHATAQEVERAIHLYWIACGRTGHYLDNLCRSWRDALDEFTYTSLTIPDDFTRVTQDSSKAEEVIQQALRRVMQEHPDIEHFGIYISVPATMIDAARAYMGATVVDSSRVSYEPVRGNQEAGCLMR